MQNDSRRGDRYCCIYSRDCWELSLVTPMVRAQLPGVAYYSVNGTLENRGGFRPRRHNSVGSMSSVARIPFA